MPTDIKLITAAAFHALAKKGATAEDVANLSIYKAGKILRRKAAPAAADSRSVSMILSNGSRDREGDTIAVEGWQLQAYLSNPVVCWAHLHDELSIAKATDVGVIGANLTAVDEFAGPELYPFADTVLRMIRGGFLNACSVGFRPIEWDMADEGEGVAFKQSELLEHSICCVPAHPEALVIARSRGIDTRPLKAWCERVLDMEKSTGDAAVKVRAQVERLRAQSDPTGRRVFVALSHVKLPADAVDPSEHAALLQLKDTLAGAGTSLSVAANALDELLGMTTSRSSKEQTAPSGVPPGVTGAPPASGDDDPEEETNRLTIVAQACTDAAASATAVAQAAVDLGGKPPTKATPAPRRRGTSVLELDDEVDLNFDLDPQLVADVIGKVVAEKLMAVTGKVW